MSEPTGRRTPNKLVRDKVPDRLITEGRAFKARRIQNRRARLLELFKKLDEEIAELKTAHATWDQHEDRPVRSGDHLLQLAEELGDVQDVLDAIRHSVPWPSPEYPSTKADSKRDLKGTFINAVFLEWFEWTDEDETKSQAGLIDKPDRRL